MNVCEWLRVFFYLLSTFSCKISCYHLFKKLQTSALQESYIQDVKCYRFDCTVQSYFENKYYNLVSHCYLIIIIVTIVVHKHLD